MADKTTTGLTAGTLPLDGTELHYVIQGGNSRKVAGSEIVKIAHNQAWSTITSTPTTLSGYGITDAATSTQGGKADTALQPGAIGLSVQAHGATLDSLEGLSLVSGDVLYATAADTLARLAKGADGQVLKLASGIPAWGTVAGSGDVVGPASSTNGNLAVFDGTTGKLVKDGGALGALAAKDTIAVPDDITASGTADATTFLRGDGAWAPAGAGDMLAANNLSDLSSTPTARANLVVGTFVADRTALKALDTTKDTLAYLKEPSREGQFVWMAGDYSAYAAADPDEAVYVKADAIAVTAGIWVRALVEKVNAAWCGADLSKADNQPSVQAAINLASFLGKDVSIPDGSFEHASGLFLPSVNNVVPGLHGAGSDKTTLKFAAGVGQAINIVGVSGDIAYRFRFNGLSLEGNSDADIGVLARKIPWSVIEDVYIRGFGTGFYGLDFLSSAFKSCQFRFNKTGLKLEKAVSSDPNAVSFFDCNFGLNSYRGAEIIGATTLSFTGGAFEGNGIYGSDPNRCGLYLGSCGGAGAAGVSLDSTYFEFNAAAADILIENTTLICTYNIQGSCFARYDEASPAQQNWSTNCIRVIAGSAKQVLNLIGNGFSGVGTYTPDAGRKYVAWSGNVRVIDNGGNLYESSLERPAFTGNVFCPEAMSNAWAFANSDGTIARGWNVASVTKLGTGQYQVNLAATLDNDKYLAVASVYNNAGFAAIVAPMTTTSFKVNIYDASGVATDNAFMVDVKGGFN